MILIDNKPMNRTNIYKRNNFVRKANTNLTTEKNTASSIINTAKATLKELETSKLVPKPKFRHRNLVPLLKVDGQGIKSKQTNNSFLTRARSALDGCLILENNKNLFPEGIDKDEMKKRSTFDPNRNRQHLEELQLTSPSESDSVSKRIKPFIIKRTNLSRERLKRNPIVSSPSQATTRGSDSLKPITPEGKEESNPNKHQANLVKSIIEEEKIEASGEDSSLQALKQIENQLNIEESKIKILDEDKLESFVKSLCHSILEECQQENVVEDKIILSQDIQVNFNVKLGELIGEGAYGKVYKALNIETGEFLAVKHIEIGDLSDNYINGVESLCKEVAVYQELDHPNIVKYLGAKQENENVYIYMEYMPGGSISSMLKQYGFFEEKLIQKFAKQVVLGLEYLHSNGVIHRDVKGENIISDRDGNVKLADFGAAKCIENFSFLASVNNSELCGSIRGSMFWMAPELLNQEEYGQRIDIWSLGCTIIQMATGKHPWPNVKSFPELVYNVMTYRCPPIPDHLSECAKDFIRNCCQFDKKLRPKAKQLLDHPFLNYNN